MTPDAIAVITYPGHCVTTLLTINNLYDLTGWKAPLYVFVDDLGEQYINYKGDYIQDIKSFYNLDFTVIKFSDFNMPEIWDGWLRQQLIKLNLDRFLPGEIWYVTDGDIKISEILDYGKTPFNFVPRQNNLVHEQNQTYLQHILGSTDTFLTRNQRPIFTHHAPFRWVHKKHLQDLRFYVTDLHKNDFNIIHYNLMNKEIIIGFGPGPDSMSMTEWDLIEVYRANILKEDIGLEYWPMRTDWHVAHKAKFWTFFGTDKDIDNQYFLQYNIHVPQNIAQNILTISRT